MPVLKVYNTSYQFGNGDLLFKNISVTMNKRRVGLIGKNGVGKSIFASIISGEIHPSSGTVTKPTSLGIYHQQSSGLLPAECSIAQFLGKEQVLLAIKHIQSGDCSTKWFDIVGEQWDLETKLNQQLSEMGLPQDVDFPCVRLSGGQLAKLQLWRLFEENRELLVLDEPSNHLDKQAKQWLVNAMKNYDGSVLLISHDRELLREMEEIWELSGLGLHVFGGNYDFYAEQKSIQLQAVERQLASIDKEKKRLAEQLQRNREKAEQRASQGNRLRKDGSQSKLLLDGKKESAEDRAANRNKNAQLRQTFLQQKGDSLNSRYENLKSQKIYLASNDSRHRKVVSITDGILTFGATSPIFLQLMSGDKMHLKGDNGCGKSTLLKTLLGEQFLTQGKLQANTSFYYLDQHFGAIQPHLSMLDNLIKNCLGMKESDARTLLAGIGFRRDSVFRLGSALSGGEKMKLAMLVVSHQPTQPMLLLDEPDNHLDLDSKVLLAKVLNEYKGGFVLVSHDEDFASECGVNRQFSLE